MAVVQAVEHLSRGGRIGRGGGVKMMIIIVEPRDSNINMIL
jgi:hypothetical protein